MTDDQAPWHAHVYYAADQRPAASALRDRFVAISGGSGPLVLFVGRMIDHPVGPHPVAQYEIHFRKWSLDAVVAEVEASALRALVHPLTNDDLADHTSLGHWICGEPLPLDLSVLDPPGMNQSMARFGKSDF